MSQTNIADRLRDHRGKIKKASKLELTDFVVRFMIVDIEHYIPCIEGMLIEYFNPAWNSQATKLSFGSNRAENLWNKFHIEEDRETIKNVLRDLKIGS